MNVSTVDMSLDPAMSDDPLTDSRRSVVLPCTGTMGICALVASTSMRIAEELDVEARFPSGVEAMPSLPKAA
jgi:hypothetical protein